MQHEWNNLLNECNSASVFLTWEWLFSWWQTFKGGHQLFIISVRDTNGTLAGIGPKKKKKRYGCFRILSIIGGDSSVASDYLDILVNRNAESEIRRLILNYMINQRRNWNVLVFPNLISASPTYLALKQISEENNLVYSEQSCGICPVLHLPERYEDFISSLGSRTRRNIRNYDRRLKNNHQVEFITEHRNPDMVHTLLRLHQKRRDKLNAYTTFQHQEYIQFLNEIVSCFQNIGLNKFYAFRQNQHIVALFYFFEFQEELYLYQGGFDNSELPPNISLMHTLFNSCVRDAIDRNIRIVHLLEGDSGFKRTFTQDKIITKRVVIGNRLDHQLYVNTMFLKFKIRNTLKRMMPEFAWQQIKRNLKRID